jgi:hypothetical protein
MTLQTSNANQNIPSLRQPRWRVVGELGARRFDVQSQSCNEAAALCVLPCPHVWQASILHGDGAAAPPRSRAFSVHANICPTPLGDQHGLPGYVSEPLVAQL